MSNRSYPNLTKYRGSALTIAIALAALSALVIANMGQVVVDVSRSAAVEGAQKGKDLFRARELMEIATYEIKQYADIPETWVSVDDFHAATDILSTHTNAEFLSDCMRPIGNWSDASGSWRISPDANRRIQKLVRYQLTGISVLPLQGSGVVMAGTMVDVENSLAANDLDVISVVACASSSESSVKLVQSNLINFRGVMRTVDIKEL